MTKMIAVLRPALLLGIASCCSNPPRVVAFDVQPRTACPGDRVVITWDIVGPAKLATVEVPDNAGSADEEPTATQFAAQEHHVASIDSTSLEVKHSTWFEIRAMDANTAKDPWHAAQLVYVPADAESKRGVAAPCKNGACRGSFIVHGSEGARVRKIGHPKVRAPGLADGVVCVTHAFLANECVGPGEERDVSLPLDGEWTLSLPDAAAAAMPPKVTPVLQIDLTIGC